MQSSILSFYARILLMLSLFLSCLLYAGWFGLTTGIELQFFLMVALIVCNYINTRRITLFQIWVAAYIYIIWSDMMLISLESDAYKYIESIAFLIATNAVFLLSYEFYKPQKHQVLKEYALKKTNSQFINLIIFFFVLYLGSTSQTLKETFLEGRQLDDVLGTTSIWGMVASTFGLVIPVLAAYYFKFYSNKSCYFSLLFALPIFAIQAILGTRFRLLFMIIPYLVILGWLDVKRMSWKKITVVGVMALCIGVTTNYIKEFRGKALEEAIGMEMSSSYDSSEYSLFVKLADKMSPEGIVKMTRLANDYFSENELTYGREILFAFYFVVPRSIWPSKPTPIDNWLIRRYENVEDTFSTASGFTGEIRADFGMACFLVLILWGCWLKKADEYTYSVYLSDSPSFEKNLAALIFPYVFFFVRSPLTATQSFLFELMIYYLIKRFYTTKYTDNSFADYH